MKTSIATIAAFVAIAAASNNTVAENVLASDVQVNHLGYTLTYNCAGHTADRWTYTLDKATGDAARPSSFYVDPDVSTSCQQKTTATYKTTQTTTEYDRGHLVASAHMGNSVEQRRQSHYMTNIAPQVAGFNRGIWERTEAIEACYRELKPLTTYGGLVYTDASNDYFVDTHGIKTPDFWWKVVVTKDATTGKDKIISWYFPNQPNLGTLDKYLVSVNDIESRLVDGLGPIPVASSLKSFKATANWELPAGCTRSL
ncbi:unnamed protein product [Aphanomyces euteiches]|uniref:Endonuclease n=1 Tax=Aphanomyces euteiches TaxID=100861 RepID=A0A6G0WXC8_9STRA|nr:hypothetical protein Ae201684_010663 [Aphanomyces euteiches]KAH9090145.1 hypothetical protein Ae201684P_014896 [Aphanomyces euteiches]KAH9115261.1 hypothetical protein AeMF1_010699 [Aphanomyces euteiches]KAH9118051.1 hypothetical protein LEN26_012276 [Aphanomyces euteiches]KAH9191286.1 hypothetical protein AeNC1_006735 [Aphanomyces euteiches]